MSRGIYCLSSIGSFKIGMSNKNAIKRAESQSSPSIKVAWVIFCDDPKLAESAAHHACSKVCGRHSKISKTEWFLGDAPTKEFVESNISSWKKELPRRKRNNCQKQESGFLFPKTKYDQAVLGLAKFFQDKGVL